MDKHSLETQKMELRTAIKALTHKQSKLACSMANDVGITGDFFHDQIPFGDKRINPYVEKRYHVITEKLHDAEDQLEKLEYTSERYTARKKVFDFIKDLPVDITISVLRRYGCLTTLELVEKVILYPDLLDEVMV